MFKTHWMLSATLQQSKEEQVKSKEGDSGSQQRKETQGNEGQVARETGARRACAKEETTRGNEH